jgi:hypothetical protein
VSRSAISGHDRPRSVREQKCFDILRRRGNDRYPLNHEGLAQLIIADVKRGATMNEISEALDFAWANGFLSGQIEREFPDDQDKD